MASKLGLALPNQLQFGQRSTDPTIGGKQITMLVVFLGRLGHGPQRGKFRVELQGFHHIIAQVVGDMSNFRVSIHHQHPKPVFENHQR
jgi:hypothetical protein